MPKKTVPLAVFLETCNDCVHRRESREGDRCSHPDKCDNGYYRQETRSVWYMHGRKECDVFYPKRQPWWRRMLKGLGF